MSSSREEDVIGLDVSVHQSVVVQMLNSYCDLCSDVPGEVLGKDSQLGKQ